MEKIPGRVDQGFTEYDPIVQNSPAVCSSQRHLPPGTRPLNRRILFTRLCHKTMSASIRRVRFIIQKGFIHSSKDLLQRRASKVMSAMFSVLAGCAVVSVVSQMVKVKRKGPISFNVRKLPTAKGETTCFTGYAGVQQSGNAAFILPPVLFPNSPEGN